MEPDIGELGEAGETGAVERAFDDLVGIETAEGGTAVDGDGVGVAFADVGECYFGGVVGCRVDGEFEPVAGGYGEGADGEGAVWELLPLRFVSAGGCVSVWG